MVSIKKLRYGEHVKVISGFYRGITGRVNAVEEEMTENDTELGNVSYPASVEVVFDKSCRNRGDDGKYSFSPRELILLKERKTLDVC